MSNTDYNDGPQPLICYRCMLNWLGRKKDHECPMCGKEDLVLPASETPSKELRKRAAAAQAEED